MPSLTAAPAWTLSDQVACHREARLDLARPAAGLVASGGDELLGLDLRTPGVCRPVECWVRARDLVAIYEPADPRRLRATAMWHACRTDAPAWELIVSCQTALVESDPAIAVRCDIAGGDLVIGTRTGGRLAWSPSAAASSPHMAAILPADADCLLVRRGGDGVLIASHPADPHRFLARRHGDRLELTCWLFSTTIEKGVLLRSRVLAAAGPAADTAWADELVDAFAGSPPPLTA